ncbi:unnamed protein product [Choristocarpus tenellus]
MSNDKCQMSEMARRRAQHATRRMITFGLGVASRVASLTKNPELELGVNHWQCDPASMDLSLGPMPEYVLCYLFSFLDAKSLCTVRRLSVGMFRATDHCSETLWGTLLRQDFPVGHNLEVSNHHQEYVINVKLRATDEVSNFHATRRARQSLYEYSSRFGGVIGLVCDLGYVEDARVARAISNKRRPAMSTAIVDNSNVICDFRKRGYFSGPLNFLPVDAISLEGSLPPIPGGPHRGFLGYAVDLVRLRPEHEMLRLTVLFAALKDLAVFETCADAEEARRRSGQHRLLYCALDFGDGDPVERERGLAVAHISHWGFRPLFDVEGAKHWGRAFNKGWGGVENTLLQLEKTVEDAQSSLAYIRYGGGIS